MLQSHHIPVEQVLRFDLMDVKAHLPPVTAMSL